MSVRNRNELEKKDKKENAEMIDRLFQQLVHYSSFSALYLNINLIFVNDFSKRQRKHDE